MIPWFIVHLIGWLASPFGFDVYVRAWSDNWWGAERIYFTRRPSGAQRLRKVSAYAGGPLLAADKSDIAYIPTREAGTTRVEEVLTGRGYPPFMRPTDPAPEAWPS